MKASHIVVATAVVLVVLVGLIFWAENTQAPFWNSLRPLEGLAESLNLWTTIIVFLLALGMLYISAGAYQKNHSKRFLFLVLAFGIMTAKFAVKLIDHFYSPGEFFSSASQNVFDLFVLAALFWAIIRKD
ncbi:MAG: hypothetical protein Q7R47_06655 [Candidatus Diapherotrites archaeon]|nr:hypothetical protein [Candidatus Diapherotrites archaeon]